jgi:hypothetical protein
VRRGRYFRDHGAVCFRLVESQNNEAQRLHRIPQF